MTNRNTQRNGNTSPQVHSTSIIATFVDIVERNQAEETLRASQELNQAVLDSLTAHIAVLDSSGTIIATNEAWEQFARDNGGDAACSIGVGANYLDVCRHAIGEASQETSAVLSGLHSVLNGEQGLFTLEYPCHAPEQQRWFLLKATRLRGQRGGAVVSHIDITGRKMAERDLIAAHAEALRARDEVATINTQLQRVDQQANELHASMEREYLTTSVMLAAISSILICIDENDWITQWNAAAEQAFGIAAKDVQGEPLRDCSISWNWTVMQEYIANCRQMSQPVRLDNFHFIRQGGTEGILGITLTPIPISEKQQTGILLLGADITERKFMESQLAHAQKMESIGQLAAGIAHEINTPTQYIGDNLRFLKEAFEDLSSLLAQTLELVGADNTGAIPAELITRMETVIKQVDLDYLLAEIPSALHQSLDGIARVTRIVQAMKEFSHPGTEEKVAIDINRAIDSTVTVARNEWKYVAEVITEFDVLLPPVPCLPGDFNQVILNIVVNAAHAIAEVIGQDEMDKGVITVRTRLAGDWAEIRISDTGSGIPEAIRTRIFDPFFTTKEVGRGTGQGLAIAHAIIVDKHGGTIHFETEMGRGTTFIIRLPLGEAQPCERTQIE